MGRLPTELETPGSPKTSIYAPWRRSWYAALIRLTPQNEDLRPVASVISLGGCPADGIARRLQPDGGRTGTTVCSAERAVRRPRGFRITVEIIPRRPRRSRAK